ncbi:hypothetical protein LguiA_026627 [Lonicera macranthoides]
MSSGETLQLSMASVVEDVLQQHGKRLSDIDLASRKAEEASLRRHEAAEWLRKTVGVVGAKDLPAEPSEEAFRLGLRRGIILCNALNKVKPGAVQKVVEAPDPDSIPDGAALSAFQYFENVRNFLVAVAEIGLPTFEASDLEQGGNSARIVNCVLALKAYSEGKHGGWKFGGNFKPSSSGKQFVRKNSEPFMNSFLKNSLIEKSLDSLSSEQFLCGDLGRDLSEMGNSRHVHMLVRELLSDKKQEEIPIIVENMLSKVTEEFERRLANLNEQTKTTTKEMAISRSSSTSSTNESPPKPASEEIEMDENATPHVSKEERDNDNKNDIQREESEGQTVKQQKLFKQHQRYLKELKQTLSTAKADMQFLQMKHQEEVSKLGKHLHGLAHAASGYQKVLKENRKLYNQVQDLKGSIRVYCRVRPFLPGQANRLSTVDRAEEGNITILTPSKYGKEGRKSFTFNKVFGPLATQEEVFSDTQPLIRSVLDGYNVCIFAYGQTGSGKTYTMTGPNDLTPESLGVNFRALSDLFFISEQRKDLICYEISVQMMEIYNEQVRDLLSADGEIRNSCQNGINVPDASLIPVSSTSDVINLMNLGLKNRAMSSTAMNDRSSRSHSCLTVHVQGRDLTTGTTVRGCMHLIDLAGSERVDKSEVVGDRLKEAQHINKSLAALGDVIASLAQKNAHVPYRNSKLTQLLQDSLGGQAKTLMFVHISPEADAVGETISTLKFAERVSTIELGAARANKDSSDVKELKEQIASLKAALVRKDEESGHIQRSKSASCTETPGMISVSPSFSNLANFSANRLPMEDVGNIEVKHSSASKHRRHSLDTQDKKAEGVGEWVEKVVGNNKQGDISRDERWEEDNRQNPEFYKRCTPDPSKIYPEQNLNKLLVSRSDSQEPDVNRNRHEGAASTTTDESDDLDASTSDFSDTDFLWQNNAPKTTSAPNGVASKLKRPSSRQGKSQETRSIPQPPTRRLSSGGEQTSRRLSSGGASPMPKTGRTGSSDGRKKTGSSK